MFEEKAKIEMDDDSTKSFSSKTTPAESAKCHLGNGIKFKGVNVLDDNEIREGIKEYSEWPTIPQLYIKEEFIGGCDIIKEMFEKGDLQKKLTEKKIQFKN